MHEGGNDLLVACIRADLDWCFGVGAADCGSLLRLRYSGFRPRCSRSEIRACWAAGMQLDRSSFQDCLYSGGTRCEFVEVLKFNGDMPVVKSFDALLVCDWKVSSLVVDTMPFPASESSNEFQLKTIDTFAILKCSSGSI